MKLTKLQDFREHLTSFLLRMNIGNPSAVTSCIIDTVEECDVSDIEKTLVNRLYDLLRDKTIEVVEIVCNYLNIGSRFEPEEEIMEFEEDFDNPNINKKLANRIGRRKKVNLRLAHPYSMREKRPNNLNWTDIVRCSQSRDKRQLDIPCGDLMENGICLKADTCGFTHQYGAVIKSQVKKFSSFYDTPKTKVDYRSCILPNQCGYYNNMKRLPGKNPYEVINISSSSEEDTRNIRHKNSPPVIYEPPSVLDSALWYKEMGLVISETDTDVSSDERTFNYHRSLIVSNIPEELNRIGLLDKYFRNFGALRHIEVNYHRDSSKAVVEFRISDDMVAAHKSNEAVLGNRFITTRPYIIKKKNKELPLLMRRPKRESRSRSSSFRCHDRPKIEHKQFDSDKHHTQKDLLISKDRRNEHKRVEKHHLQKVSSNDHAPMSKDRKHEHRRLDSEKHHIHNAPPKAYVPVSKDRKNYHNRLDASPKTTVYGARNDHNQWDASPETTVYEARNRIIEPNRRKSIERQIYQCPPKRLESGANYRKIGRGHLESNRFGIYEGPTKESMNSSNSHKTEHRRVEVEESTINKCVPPKRLVSGTNGRKVEGAAESFKSKGGHKELQLDSKSSKGGHKKAESRDSYSSKREKQESAVSSNRMNICMDKEFKAPSSGDATLNKRHVTSKIESGGFLSSANYSKDTDIDKESPTKSSSITHRPLTSKDPKEDKHPKKASKVRRRGESKESGEYTDEDSVKSRSSSKSIEIIIDPIDPPTSPMRSVIICKDERTVTESMEVDSPITPQSRANSDNDFLMDEDIDVVTQEPSCSNTDYSTFNPKPEKRIKRERHIRDSDFESLNSVDPLQNPKRKVVLLGHSKGSHADHENKKLKRKIARTSESMNDYKAELESLIVEFRRNDKPGKSKIVPKIKVAHEKYMELKTLLASLRQTASTKSQHGNERKAEAVDKVALPVAVESVVRSDPCNLYIKVPAGVVLDSLQVQCRLGDGPKIQRMVQLLTARAGNCYVITLQSPYTAKKALRFLSKNNPMKWNIGTHPP